MKLKQRGAGYAKSRKASAPMPAMPAPKATPKADVNMGLGKLKGVYQERKSRLDKEMKKQGA